MLPSKGALDAGAARRLAAMAPHRIDPARPAAIKRNVHELDIDAPADRFAAALADLLVDPAAAFGLIEVRRPPERVGRGFAPGDRFAGCFRLAAAAEAWGAPAWLQAMVAAADQLGVGAWLENRLTCDHAEVVELSLVPDEHGVRRVVYRYLSGTPLAGDSRYEIVARGPATCRLIVTFTFQETTRAAVGLLHRFGVREHDRALVAQAEQAAARVGARVVAHTVRGAG